MKKLKQLNAKTEETEETINMLPGQISKLKTVARKKVSHVAKKNYDMKFVCAS